VKAKAFAEYLIVTVAGMLFFWPPIWRAAWSTDYFRSDFPLHALFAEHMQALGTITVPHFLYEGSAILLRSVFGGSITAAGAWIAVFAAGATVTVVYAWLRKDFGIAPSALCAFACALLAPLSLFTPHHLYFGYIGLTTYFNPTTILLKPLAFAHLACVITLLTSDRHRRSLAVALFLLTVLTGIAKPHYLMCLLPGLAGYCAIRWNEIRKKMGVVLCSIVLPAAILLAWQFAFVFIWGSSDYARSAFLFAPFAGMREHSLHLAPKLLASIALPAAILWYHRRTVLHRAELLLPLLLAIVGLLYSYLLVEAGERGGSMNFIRAGEISLFLLTVFAAVYHIRYLHTRYLDARRPAERKWKFSWGQWAIAMLFLLSLVSGALLYAAEWSQPGRLL